MYRIIGGDQKEYGPVSAEDLRRWISEGRLNAQSLARAEAGGDWKPLREFPEFADALGIAPGAPDAATPPLMAPASALSPEALAERDYELDIGSCIGRAWTLLGANFWPIIGIWLLIWIIEIALNKICSLIFLPPMPLVFRPGEIPQFTPGQYALMVPMAFVLAPIQTLLSAGLYNYYLKLIRNENPQMGDAFAGFSSIAGQLLLLGLVKLLLLLVGFAFCVLPCVYLSVAWVFALPLVIDRRLGFWQAMELSRRVVTRHWFIVFAFLLVDGLLMLCGVFACCIGLVVTIPLGVLALLYAYEDILGRQAH